MNSHADVSIGVVKFHLGAGLDPAHHPGFIAGNGGHHNPCCGFEIGRPVAQHYGRVLLDDSGAVVYGGRQVVHHNVLTFDAGLVTGDALDAAHVCTGEGGAGQQQQQRQPGAQLTGTGTDTGFRCIR